MTTRPRHRDRRASDYSLGRFGSPRYLHRAYEDERYMDAVHQLERQIEAKEVLKGFDPNPGTHLAKETKYLFHAKQHQSTDPDFAVVRTSKRTGVVTFFMDVGKLRPVTKELPLDEALKIADQMNRGEK